MKWKAQSCYCLSEMRSLLCQAVDEEGNWRRFQELDLKNNH